MSMTDMAEKELRKFGLTVGLVCIVIAFWPTVWRGEAARVWFLIPGVLLIVLGFSMPALLSPVFKVWMKIGHVMGWVNTRIILGVLFYGVVTPMGLVMRLTGRDPMRRGFEPDAQTYRVIRQPRPASHMKNMF